MAVTKLYATFATDMTAITNAHITMGGTKALFVGLKNVSNSLNISHLAPPPLSGEEISQSCIKSDLAHEFLFGRVLVCADFSVKN